MGSKLKISHVVMFALDPHWVAEHVVLNPQKILHAWEYGCFYECYFDQHDNGQHLILIHTFPPRRLPYDKSRTHKNIKWEPHFELLITNGLRVKGFCNERNHMYHEYGYKAIFLMFVIMFSFIRLLLAL